MTDNEILEQAAVDMVEKRGVSATYTYLGGSTPTSLKVALGTKLELQPEGTPGTYVPVDQEIGVLTKSDLTVDPVEGDIITITETGVVYTVQGLIQDSGYLVTVSLVQ